MKLLVTGAAGFIGLAVLKVLASRKGRVVFATCRQPSQALLDVCRNSSNIYLLDGCDLTRAAHVASLPRDITHVVHAMAYARFESGNTPQLYSANVLATQHLIGHLRMHSSHSLQRLLFTSSIGVHDRPRLYNRSRKLNEESPLAPASYYGATKKEAERLVAESGLPHVIARLTWVYGPGMRRDSHIRAFAKMVRKGSFFALFDFPGRIMTAYIDDVGDALVKLIEKENLRYTEYFVSHAEPVAIGQVFRHLRHLEGIPNTRVVPSLCIAPLASLGVLLPMKLRTVIEANYLVCDVARLAEEGIRLETPFHEGLKVCYETSEWKND